MNSFTLEIWSKEDFCTFYTVRIDEENYSETDKFFRKYKDDEVFKRSISELANFLIKYIGQKSGAKEIFFRFENRASALPPSKSYSIGELKINLKGFPLRLYCLRITDEIVILFNGAEKTSVNAQGGKTKRFFDEANYFCERIDKAIINKEIIIDYENGIIFSDTYEEDNIQIE